MRVNHWPGSLLALAMVLACSLAGMAPASAQQAGAQVVSCNKTAVGSSGAATTLAITGAFPQNISVCGFIASAGAAAGTFQITTGTGATCGTGTVNVIGLVNLAINSGLNYSPGVAQYTMPSPTTVGGPSFNVCVVVTGTGPVSWTLFYSQF